MTSLRNQQIELSKLVIHPNNVRLDQDDAAGIEALARNIEAFGLFQNLVVQPLDDGRFGVLGGGGRLAALALAEIRDRWLPTEANYWSQVTKAHMLDLLGQLGMADAARQMKTVKKATLAGYITRLFAAPPSTLTAEQQATIRAWAPDGMQTMAPNETAADEALAA